MEKSYIISLKDIEQPFISKNKESLYLRGINLNITKGEIFGIIGRVGSGKSTLLKCINFTKRPATGVVCIDRKNFTIMLSKELKAAQQEISTIPQQASLFSSKNIFDNVALPLELQKIPRNEIVITVNKMLALIELIEKSSCFPNQLNHAQKQKVIIARALATNPKILLCDDITSGLDSKTIQSISYILRKVNKEFNTTIVIVTHDIELIKSLCHNVGVIHKGELIEQNNTFDFFTNPASEIAKDFICASTRLEMPWIYRRNLKLQKSEQCHPLLRLVFTGLLSPEVLLTQAIEKHQIKVIIIQAHQEIMQQKTINILLIEVCGTMEEIDSACTYLKENGLFITTLGYIHDDN